MVASLVASAAATDALVVASVYAPVFVDEFSVCVLRAGIWNKIKQGGGAVVVLLKEKSRLVYR